MIQKESNKRTISKLIDKVGNTTNIQIYNSTIMETKI